jgi:hypothetical protein
MIGITLEQHEATLKRREQEIRQELIHAKASATEKIAVLEKQLIDTQAKLEDPTAALADYKKKLAQAYEALDQVVLSR